MGPWHRTYSYTLSISLETWEVVALIFVVGLLLWAGWKRLYIKDPNTIGFKPDWPEGDE